MKKTALLLILSIGTLFSLQASAKTELMKDTTAKLKANANSIIKLSVSDYNKLLSTASTYKSDVIYNPFLSGDEKTALQVTYDRYLYTLKKSTKVDSVLTLSNADYEKLVTTAEDYKAQIIYNPFLSGDEKTSIQVAFDRYLYNLKKTVKFDSIALASR